MCLYFLTTPIHIRYAIAEGNNRILEDSGVRERHQMRAATVLVNQQNIRDTLIPIYGCNTRIALGPMVITFSVKVSYFNGPCEHTHTHTHTFCECLKENNNRLFRCVCVRMFFSTFTRTITHTHTDKRELRWRFCPKPIRVFDTIFHGPWQIETGWQLKFFFMERTFAFDAAHLPFYCKTNHETITYRQRPLDRYRCRWRMRVYWLCASVWVCSFGPLGVVIHCRCFEWHRVQFPALSQAPAHSISDALDLYRQTTHLLTPRMSAHSNFKYPSRWERIECDVET